MDANTRCYLRVLFSFADHVVFSEAVTLGFVLKHAMRRLSRAMLGNSIAVISCGDAG